MEPASIGGTPLNGTENSFYDEIGGEATFQRLVAEFYQGVKQDSILAPMYPDSDWEGAQWRLEKFLMQYWGGPSDYSNERGHPRLRMRHAPYKVNPAARDAWLKHMRSALKSLALPPLQEATLWDYLERAAHSLLNSFED